MVSLHYIYCIETYDLFIALIQFDFKTEYMLNTPKKPTTLSHTKSEVLFRTAPRKSRHESVRKNKQIDYKTILNKLLTITNYDKLIKLASIYVDKQVLLCKKLPNMSQQLKNGSKANIFYYQFINDGRFIKKLAQLSQNPLVVCRHFRPFVRIYRDLFKSYFSSLDKGDPTNQPQDQDDRPFGQPKESQEQRQFRLYGFSKRKQEDRENGKKDNVIVFSQFIKENHQWRKSYLQVKKQYESRRSQIKGTSQNEQKQNLKRSDLNQFRRKYNIQPKPKKHKVIFFPGAIDRLTQIEKEIVVKYPRLKYLLLGQDKQHHFIADYGHYKGHKVTLVGIEVQTTFESEDFFEEDIRHVLKIEATGESDKEGSLEEIEGDKFVMYMHKYE